MGFQNITGWMGFQKKDQLNLLLFDIHTLSLFHGLVLLTERLRFHNFTGEGASACAQPSSLEASKLLRTARGRRQGQVCHLLSM